MRTRELLRDAPLSVVAGYAATKAMEQFNMKTHPLESEQERQREDAVRPGPPFRLAAENLSERILGIRLSEDQGQQGGHGVPLPRWSVVGTGAVLLRREVGWGPVRAGLAAGASMSLILDEIARRRSARQRPTASTRCRPMSGRSPPTWSSVLRWRVFETGWRLFGERP